MLINLDCPIECIDYKIYKSKSTGKVFCSLKFNNLSFNYVKGLKAKVYCYDEFGDPIKEDNNSFECKIEFKELLKKVRETEDKIELIGFANARKIDIEITKILFDDKSIWEKGSSISEMVELHEIDNPKLLKFVMDREDNDAKYFAKEYEDKWSCVCGRINYSTDVKCKRCDREKEHVFINYSNEEKINEDFSVFEIEKEESDRKARIEQEQQLQIKKQKTKKVAKYGSIVATLLFIISVATFGFLTKFTFSMENYHLLKDKNNGLIEAVKSKDIENIEFLIKNGADVNFENSEGEMPITEAIKLGDVSIVEKLIELGVKTEEIGASSETVLHLALKYNQLEMLKHFIEDGFDPSIRNGNDETLLYTAVKNNSLNQITYLINDLGLEVNNIDKEENNALQVALTNSLADSAIIRELLKTNIDFEKSNQAGYNTYQTAILRENVSVIDLFLEAKKLDLNNIDNNGNNALHFLISEKAVTNQFISFLIEKGADVNVFNKEGYSPLYIAIKNGQQKSVEQLLENEANINKVTTDGKTAIDVAKGKDAIEKVIKDRIEQIRRINEEKRIAEINEKKQIEEIQDIVINYHINENGFVSITPDLEVINLKMNQKIILKPKFTGGASERVLMDGTILNPIDEQTIKAISRGTGDLSILPNDDWKTAKIYKIIVH